jgi:hypothetical protein
VRVLKTLPDGELKRLLEHTEELPRFIDNELGPLLTSSEREATVFQTKRKLSSMVREREEAKRQRRDSALVTDAVQRRASEGVYVAQAEYGGVVPEIVVHSPSFVSTAEKQPPQEQDA